MRRLHFCSIVLKNLIPPDINFSGGIDFFTYINNNMVILLLHCEVNKRSWHSRNWPIR